MKKLYLVLIIFSLMGCKSNTLDNNTTIAQLCLDKMYQNKDYSYLEKSDLILIKNIYSSTLGGVHFGKKQVILKNVLPVDIKPYGNPQDAIENGNKRYIAIKSMLINTNSATIILTLPNVNQTIIFYLVIKDSIWKIDHVKSFIS